MKLFQSRRALSITLAAVIVLAIGGVASASIPSADGRIQSCVARNGAVRVVDTDAGARCASSEKRLAWNQRGPAGVAGATGPAGPAGPAGPPGPAGGDTAAPIIKNGHCDLRVPTTARAGTRLLLKCLHNGPELRNVSITPVHHGGYADPVYVLQPVLDYSWQVDVESGTAAEIWVLIRIMRNLPYPGVAKDILVTWIGMP